ncbi:MAG: acetyl-CoA carboxylase biotin carboxylase subunit [Euryarchaeota archaeon]|nr:acetyl-CoA carboxylase biotin carboxylase subunit [Euryarchaeota archaeon]
MFERILVANRGEIALRVMKAATEMGIETIAVHSDADERAPHVKIATSAVRLGPAPPAESYLRIDLILQAAERTGCDSIHPGYGFLSENAMFARACGKAGIKFIGPSPEAMEVLGDKVRARALAIREGVPVAPGSDGALADPAEAERVAARIGYPVILKAAAGGGGMGMRIVRDGSEIGAMFDAASSQAAAAFGNGSVFIEKFLERPRHIEVQVLGDEKGHLIHLGERECSIQRRHQKLLEEAPSPALGQAQRSDLGELAVKLAKAGGYTNAGTMEFLYSNGRFNFNEMNTRLQVEHPVTEMVTGVDIVKWQIRIAAGEPLTLHQRDIRTDGHAIECRINAEDPLNDFRPSPGRVTRYSAPSMPGIRIDSAIVEGLDVPSHYDGLVAKVIAWGPTRPEAAARMRAALGSFTLSGLPSNVGFHRVILADEAFLKGDLSTRFIEERGIIERTRLEEEKRVGSSRQRAALIAAALAVGGRGGLGAAHHSHTLPPRRSREAP